MNAIREYLEEKKLNYRELSRMTGINLTTIWRHAYGRGRSARRIGVDMALIYHEKLGIKLERLLQR